MARAPSAVLAALFLIGGLGVTSGHVVARQDVLGAQGPFISLVYHGPGVAVVGTSPVADGSPFGGPPQLYISTDTVHWASVAPPASQARTHGPYVWFDQASFINALTGWVSTWGPATLGGAIYGTTDGGRTWRWVSAAGHGDHGGDALWLQLLTPEVAFTESVAATAPAMQLEVTTNGGRSWRSVYRGPPPLRSGSERYRGPFEMPMEFADRERGFSALGIPPAEGLNGEGDFFVTDDGGATWARQSPPLPGSSHRCPTGAGNWSSVSCSFAAPSFSGPDDGVLAGAIVFGSHAQVAFDLTSDDGRSWHLTSQRAASVTPGRYPLVSVATTSAWWLLGWGTTDLTTQVSPDGGATWMLASASTTGGAPLALNALGPSRALLTMQHESPRGTTTWLMVTANAGRSWHRLSLR